MPNKLKIPVSLGRIRVGKGEIRRTWASRQLVLSTYSIHLTQYCAFSKEEWLPCIHQDQVKVGLPWSMGTPRLMKMGKSKSQNITPNLEALIFNLTQIQGM